MNFWVLVANASLATLYGTKSLYQGSLTILKQFSHQESRQKGEDLISDRFGNYHEKNSPSSGFEQINPKKIEHEKFALSLADALKKGHAQHHYEKLIIVAESRFYGLLKQHLPNIPNVIHLNKEYIGLSEKELLSHLTTLLP